MANCTGRFSDAGRAILARLLKDTDNPPSIYVAWGTGTADLAATDTGLGFERERKRGAVTRSVAGTYVVTATFQSVPAGTFSEIGLFDDPASGTMLYRGGYSTDSPIGVDDVESLTVAAGDAMIVTITISLKSTYASITSAGISKALGLLCETAIA